MEKNHKYQDEISKINYLTEEVDSLYHQAALRLGVSDSVLLVLYMMYTKGDECFLYDIYKMSGISKQTINSAIRKLESEDIVYLKNHNGKTKIVCLTEKGHDFVQQTGARLFEAECNAFSDWDEDEIDLYLSLIKKHNDSLKTQIEKL